MVRECLGAKNVFFWVEALQGAAGRIMRAVTNLRRQPFRACLPVRSGPRSYQASLLSALASACQEGPGLALLPELVALYAAAVTPQFTVLKLSKWSYGNSA